MSDAAKDARTIPKRSRVPAPPLYFNSHDLSEALASETGYVLSYVAQMAQLVLEELLEPLHIDARQLGVMKLIAESEHRSQVAISQNMGLDRTHVVRLVDDLEGLGYVQRVKSTEDRRYYELILTPEGERVLSETRKVIGAADDDTYGCLNDAERETLHRLLRKVAEQRFPGQQRDEK